MRTAGDTVSDGDSASATIEPEYTQETENGVAMLSDIAIDDEPPLAVTLHQKLLRSPDAANATTILASIDTSVARPLCCFTASKNARHGHGRSGKRKRGASSSTAAAEYRLDTNTPFAEFQVITLIPTAPSTSNAPAMVEVAAAETVENQSRQSPNPASNLTRTGKRKRRSKSFVLESQVAKKKKRHDRREFLEPAKKSREESWGDEVTGDDESVPMEASSDQVVEEMVRDCVDGDAVGLELVGNDTVEIAAIISLDFTFPEAVQPPGEKPDRLRDMEHGQDFICPNAASPTDKCSKDVGAVDSATLSLGPPQQDENAYATAMSPPSPRIPLRLDTPRLSLDYPDHDALSPASSVASSDEVDKSTLDAISSISIDFDSVDNGSRIEMGSVTDLWESASDDYEIAEFDPLVSGVAENNEGHLLNETSALFADTTTNDMHLGPSDIGMFLTRLNDLVSQTRNREGDKADAAVDDTALTMSLDPIAAPVTLDNQDGLKPASVMGCGKDCCDDDEV
ncbi:hypothetical protein HDU96_008268 [Phlyctochytrium bullatum]|nr:hypothetical protein HDU96_008268 [Phlyctochytrium bullatum]